MKKRIVSGLILVILICGMYVIPALAASYATVVGGWLRLRSSPSYSATVIASYKTGTLVTVLSSANGWSRVLTNDYRIGYMDSRYLSASGSSTPTAAPTPYNPGRTWTTVNRTAFVTSANGRGVRLRNSPVVNSSNVMGLYPVGRTVTELRVSNDGWSYIRIDGKYGYMMSQFLTTGSVPVTPPPTPPVWNTPTPTVPSGNTPTPIPVPTSTPAPTSQTVDIQSVGLSPVNPVVGQTIKLLVTPSNAEYIAVWYDGDNRLLLANGSQYKVTSSEAGKKIYVRVMGTGVSSGFMAIAETDIIGTPAATVTDSSSGTGTTGMESTWVDGVMYEDYIFEDEYRELSPEDIYY